MSTSDLLTRMTIKIEQHRDDRARNEFNLSSERRQRPLDSSRRPSLPVLQLGAIPEELKVNRKHSENCLMSSVGRSRSRRPSLAEWTQNIFDLKIIMIPDYESRSRLLIE
ncbi:hypothetical protein Tcan_12443 [Toxocara canis]|uniref:Uncharacterized protein n=1 Tax=Toxocara canis TaxID=6265 RepID=A0A0B2V9I1_TOXCA|nr:hypothetical protein Tcan_12443 [Toxocara canis]